ncbi:MAG: SDR family NAD(P)-dependent oxidoreductase [Puniceicoccaceae bacterium]
MSHSKRFQDKVAIVTGGTAGIGYAIAEALCQEGCKVSITGLEQDGDEAYKKLQETGYKVELFPGNMKDEAFCQHVVEATADKWGTINYLVNNAFSFLAKALDAKPEDWEHTYAVGPIAYALMTQLVTPHMEKSGAGSIVNVSSISGFVAQKERWTYNCAKGAVNQLTKCSALDLASKGIRVNSVSPGWIWTREVDKAAGGDREKYTPVWGAYHMLRRLGFVEEVAKPVLFLLSDDASFITGTDLPVDGGYQSMGPEGLGDTAIVAGSE